MSDHSPIGGFFEIEVPVRSPGIHQNATCLSTGRSCLMAILEYLKPKRCFLPHYTCDATIHPFQRLNVEVVFYEIDRNFEPTIKPTLSSDDCFLLTNYWGMQRDLVDGYSETFRHQLIIDNTHDFFAVELNRKSWSFTSARKYFGVPDGAFLYCPHGTCVLDVVAKETPRFQDISLNHSINRQRGKQELAFQQYQEYEKGLNCKLELASQYSETILSMVDYDLVAKRRIQNFETLASAFKELNAIDLSRSENEVPFAYPFLPIQSLDKKLIYAESIFPPSLWADIPLRPGISCSTALTMAKDLLPLPIDHRYGEIEMNRIIETIFRLMHG